MLGRSPATEPYTLSLGTNSLMYGIDIHTFSRPRDLNVSFCKVEAIVSVFWAFLWMA